MTDASSILNDMFSTLVDLGLTNHFPFHFHFHEHPTPPEWLLSLDLDPGALLESLKTLTLHLDYKEATCEG